MKIPNEMQGNILTIAGCAYLTYVLYDIWKHPKKAKKILLLVLSILLGILLVIADPEEAIQFPAAVAVFHFLFRFLRLMLSQIVKNLRNMTQPIRYEAKKSTDPEKATVPAERQAT